MSKTYAQIQKEIAALAAQAEKLRSEDKAKAVAQAKALISEYGLSAAELFGAKGRQGKTVVKAKSGGARAAKYGDGSGNTWIGLGKRPQWLVQALAAGKKLEDFLLGVAGAAVAAEAPRKRAASTGVARKAPAKKAAVARKSAAATKSAGRKSVATKAAKPSKAAKPAKAEVDSSAAPV